MSTDTGRRAAGATMLLLPLAAGVLMWSTAGDVLRPEIEAVAARVPGVGAAEPADGAVQHNEVPGYRYVATAGDDDVNAVLSRLIELPTKRPQGFAALEDAAGRHVGLVLSVDDARRGTGHPDGALNLRALVRGSSSVAFSETQVGDASVYVGRDADHSVVVWQEAHGFTLLAGKDHRGVAAFVSALQSAL